MNARELKTRIDTWLQLADQPRMPPAPTSIGEVMRVQLEAEWGNALLKNARELEVVPELRGTQVEMLLSEAIRLATAGDPAKLSSIQHNLRQVQKYMFEKHL